MIYLKEDKMTYRKHIDEIRLMDQLIKDKRSVSEMVIRLGLNMEKYFAKKYINVIKSMPDNKREQFVHIAELIAKDYNAIQIAEHCPWIDMKDKKYVNRFIGGISGAIGKRAKEVELEAFIKDFVYQSNRRLDSLTSQLEKELGKVPKNFIKTQDELIVSISKLEYGNFVNDSPDIYDAVWDFTDEVNDQLKNRDQILKNYDELAVMERLIELRSEKIKEIHAERQGFREAEYRADLRENNLQNRIKNYKEGIPSETTGKVRDVSSINDPSWIVGHDEHWRTKLRRLQGDTTLM